LAWHDVIEPAQLSSLNTNVVTMCEINVADQQLNKVR